MPTLFRVCVALRRSDPTYSLNMEQFNLKILNEVRGKEQYRAEASNRFAAAGGLEAEVDINRASESIRKNITISAKGILGYYKLKKV